MKSGGTLLWFLLAGAVALGAIWRWWPLPDASLRTGNFPLRGLFFDSRELPLTPDETGIFGQAKVLKRLVRVKRTPVVVLVIDGTLNRHAVHDPLFCYRGAGWQVTAETTLRLERGSAKRVTLRLGTREAEAIYWFSDGVRSHPSILRYWWDATIRRLTLGATGPEPVLVILTTLEGEMPRWEELLVDWPAVQQL
jgi:hypothetical protein